MLDNYFPVIRSTAGATDCMLLYYFSTEDLEASDSEEPCNEAPYWALYCVDVGIILVSV